MLIEPLFVFVSVSVSILTRLVLHAHPLKCPTPSYEVELRSGELKTPDLDER